jgi:peptidoglycan/LPS O-acetylase OafA/YrhL
VAFALSLAYHFLTFDDNYVFYFFGSRIWQFLFGTLSYFLMRLECTSTDTNCNESLISIDTDNKSDEKLIKSEQNPVTKKTFLSSTILYQQIFAHLSLTFMLFFWFLFQIEQKICRFFAVVFTFCLLAFGKRIIRPCSYVLNNAILQFIGNISYSVYLFHWPVLLFFKYYFLSHTNDNMPIDIAIFIIILSLIIGFCSYNYVELKLTHIVATKTLVFIIVGYFVNFFLIYIILNRSSSNECSLLLTKNEGNMVSIIFA